MGGSKQTNSCTASYPIASPIGASEAAVALATSEAHRQARALRDLTNASDPALAFFFGQVAYLFSRCRAGNPPRREDLLALATTGVRAFGQGGRV